MKVTQVAICPAEGSAAAGRPALTPELLAATGARYSRSNEGLDSILARIDPERLDASVESIFRMIDYGHQSIADMVPVALFLDGISLWLAYFVWSLSPTAGGQESSTRYIRMSPQDIVAPEEAGIPASEKTQWRRSMEHAFGSFHESLTFWEDYLKRFPQSARIPSALAASSEDKARRQVARMRRNFAFDRARYFLPAAATTNVMMIMSARGWAQLCQTLLSHSLPEPRSLGTQIRSELALAAPRMIKYAAARQCVDEGLKQEFNRLRLIASEEAPHLYPMAETAEHSPEPSLDVLPPAGDLDPSGDLRYHDNRYAWIGSGLQRTVTRFGWEAVALAEIRDLNRHRTGTKYCPLAPVGFYCALDQVEEDRSLLQALEATGREASALSRQRLIGGDQAYIYWSLLGTQYRFEHTTTADKFLYEAELRTGTGAHYRYADHLRAALQLWYSRFPETRGMVLEGSAEPE